METGACNGRSLSAQLDFSVTQSDLNIKSLFFLFMFLDDLHKKTKYLDGTQMKRLSKLYFLCEEHVIEHQRTKFLAMYNINIEMNHEHEHEKMNRAKHNE